MTFGPYLQGTCFRIEQSAAYRALQEGVPMAEFLLLRAQASPPSVWIVEAKSSSPRPETQPAFDEFIGEIRDKLANALGLGIAAILKRHPLADEELPAAFQALDLTSTGFKLVLVIHGHQKKWLPPMQDALRRALRATTKTWALGPNTVAVINEAGAKWHRLISEPLIEKSFDQSSTS